MNAPVDPQFAARCRASFGGALVARGEVVKAGRSLTVARAEVYAEDGKHLASMQQTLMMLPDTPDTPE